jgi:hypothetical protein
MTEINLFDLSSFQKILDEREICSVEKIYYNFNGVKLSSHYRVLTEEKKVDRKLFVRKINIDNHIEYVLSGNNRFYHLHFCNLKNFDSINLMSQFFASKLVCKEFLVEKLHDRIIFHIDTKRFNSCDSEIIVTNLNDYNLNVVT